MGFLSLSIIDFIKSVISLFLCGIFDLSASKTQCILIVKTIFSLTLILLVASFSNIYDRHVSYFPIKKNHCFKGCLTVIVAGNGLNLFAFTFALMLLVKT